MCGIGGIYFHDPAQNPFKEKEFSTMIDSMLKGIESRGRDATGIAAVSKTGQLHIEKADLEASNFSLWRSDVPRNAQTVLLHTRYATQGTPMNLDNNHPILYDDVLVTHNGHISNDDELFKEEELERKAQVDSEIIAALFQKHGIDKAHIPLQKLDGNMAVAVSDLRKPNTLVLAKSWHSPLEYYLSKQGIIWASTKSTIQDALEDSLNFKIKYGDIDSLQAGEILLLENGSCEKLQFKSYVKPYEKKSYSYSWDDNRTRYQGKQTSCDIDDADADDHAIAYKLKIGNETFVYKKCDECSLGQKFQLMKKLGQFLLCSYCYKNYEKEQEEIVVEAEELTTFSDKDSEQSLDDAHEVTCQLLAEKYNTTQVFVEWLLFQTEDTDFDETDQNTINMYMLMNDDYDDIYKELTGIDNRPIYPAADRLALEMGKKNDDDTMETQ